MLGGARVGQETENKQELLNRRPEILAQAIPRYRYRRIRREVCFRPRYYAEIIAATSSGELLDERPYLMVLDTQCRCRLTTCSQASRGCTNRVSGAPIKAFFGNVTTKDAALAEDGYVYFSDDLFNEDQLRVVYNVDQARSPTSRDRREREKHRRSSTSSFRLL